MIPRQEICAFLDDYLAIHEFPDSSWNGLQIEGKSDVRQIGVAVDSGMEVFEEAVRQDVDFLIVHHGHFWKALNPSLVGWQKKRIELLNKHRLSLYAAHLPLDRHVEIGNNVQLLKVIGARIEGDFSEYQGVPISYYGRIPKGNHIQEIKQILDKKLSTATHLIDAGAAIVETVAVCSGSGGYSGFYEALNIGADLYITGDRIDVYQTAKDAGMNVIFTGHHASETLGIKALVEKVKKECNTDTVFIDVPSGL